MLTLLQCRSGNWKITGYHLDMRKAGLNTLLSAICFELCRESIISTVRLLLCRRQQRLSHLPV